MKKIFFGLLVIGSFTGCLKNDNQQFTCTYNECATVAPAAEIQDVKDYLAANNLTATQHCSGLFYTIDDPGTGATPTACSYVAFSYVGKLADGTTFDSSATPIATSVSGLITGFKNGLLKMKTGGEAHLYIPPSLAYGSTPPNGIPANAMLVFDVKLAGVQ